MHSTIIKTAGQATRVVPKANAMGNRSMGHDAVVVGTLIGRQTLSPCVLYITEQVACVQARSHSNYMLSVLNLDPRTTMQPVACASLSMVMHLLEDSLKTSYTGVVGIVSGVKAQYFFARLRNGFLIGSTNKDAVLEMLKVPVLMSQSEDGREPWSSAPPANGLTLRLKGGVIVVALPNSGPLNDAQLASLQLWVDAQLVDGEQVEEFISKVAKRQEIETQSGEESDLSENSFGPGMRFT